MGSTKQSGIVPANIEVRDSGVHGKGVFAKEKIKRGTRVIEYTGERITWPEALDRHPHDPAQPNHTFYFHLNDELVIDGNVDGNDSRWINHSCAPNCEAQVKKKRVFIVALKTIKEGQELNYDYGLTIDEPQTEELLAEYACYCGSKNCRGTLLHFDEDQDIPGKAPEVKLLNKKADNSKSNKSSKKHEKVKAKLEDKANKKPKEKLKQKDKEKTKNDLALRENMGGG